MTITVSIEEYTELKNSLSKKDAHLTDVAENLMKACEEIAWLKEAQKKAERIVSEKECEAASVSRELAATRAKLADAQTFCDVKSLEYLELHKLYFEYKEKHRKSEEALEQAKKDLETEIIARNNNNKVIQECFNTEKALREDIESIRTALLTRKKALEEGKKAREDYEILAAETIAVQALIAASKQKAASAEEQIDRILVKHDNTTDSGCK